MTLRQQVVRGGVFFLVRQAAGTMVGLATFLLVMRVIGPAAYGTYATAISIQMYLVMIAQLGLGAYLIRNQQPLTRRDRDVAFTCLVVSGCGIGALAVAASPQIALWVRNPDVGAVAAAVFLTLPLQAIGMVGLASIERNMAFQKSGAIELVAQLAFLAVAFPLALAGYGVWAPVIGWWAHVVVVNTGYLLISAYRPRFVWDPAHARSMLSFGLGYTSSMLVWHARSLLNPLVVGRVLGPEAVAFVSLAVRFVELLAFVQGIVLRVALPALGQVQLGAARMLSAVAEGARLQVLAVGVPLMVFAIVGERVVLLLFGERWLPVMALYPLVAVAYLGRAVFDLTISALQVRGRNGPVIVVHAVYVLVFAVGAVVLVPRLGLVGYGVAELVALPAYAVLWLTMSRSVGQVDLRLALVWAIGFACATFVTHVGFLAFLPLLGCLLLPETWRSLRQLLGQLSTVRVRSSHG